MLADLACFRQDTIAQGGVPFPQRIENVADSIEFAIQQDLDPVLDALGFAWNVQ